MSESRVRPDPALALLEVYETALPEVYGYLLARCGDRGVAEDLTSETFLGAVGSLREHGTGPPSTAWLVGVARHKLVDHWRRRGREHRARPAHAPPETHDPWAGALDALAARDVLATLRPDQRTALVLRHVDGLDVPEVAAHLGRTVAATEAVLSRARAAFRAGFPDPDDRAHEGGER